MEKTYEFEGRQYRESGEVRCPKKGELFLCYDAPSVAQFTFQKDKCPILTPVETSPRILTGYVSDAKAGDVYERDGKWWVLVEYRNTRVGDEYILGSRHDNWHGVATETDPNDVLRWIVEPYVEASPAPATADGDPVQKPLHYNQGDVECIDALRSALTDDEFRGYLKGNAMKYLWRERLKNGEQDVRKSLFYVTTLAGLDPRKELPCKT